ncbi:hypothetical protein KSP40_PGU002032 [Platanthera guangdongensis]|uniref:Phosphoribosyltransferase domain-containing protein n=1 Tax=Platanthera guangdongensis TaxID=2320717 RepID=A0ABR2LPS1_9ASPA
MSMDEDLERVLWTAEEIAARIAEVAKQISDDFWRVKSPIVVVGVAPGAFLFLADLVRQITLPVAVDFIRAESYGSGTRSNGAPVITFDVKLDTSGKHIILDVAVHVDKIHASPRSGQVSKNAAEEEVTIEDEADMGDTDGIVVSEDITALEDNKEHPEILNTYLN